MTERNELQRLVDVAYRKFHLKNSYCENDEIYPYSPLAATWDTISLLYSLTDEESDFMLPGILAGQATSAPGESVADIGYGLNPTWFDLCVGLSRAVLYQELIATRPEIVEEYLQRIENFDKLE